MSTYVVTGCAGFIGARTTEHLLEQGHTVIGVDNLNDAYDRRLKDWRLAQIDGRENFHFTRLDITDRAAVRDLLGTGPQAQPVDAVINLAAYAGIRYSVENPWVYYETNVTGSLNLLDACREFGISKFVLASSSSLYGARNPVPFHEDAHTSEPLSPYAASKKAAEELCYSYHHLHGIDVSMLRFFTVYGPAGRPDMSPFRFVQWISEGRPLQLFGDGTQRRDFTFVQDIARGVEAALRPVGYEAINLGSDKPVVLMDFIHLIEELTGQTATIERSEAHVADMQATWADISKARKILDWAPAYRFRDGVEELVRWYRDNRAWASQLQTGS
jgi:UDP-glucuronate 4-epimerase